MRDLAAEVGKTKGTKWADVAEQVVRDHNEQPNPAVFGPPDSVEKNPVQQFKILQQNATHYAQNAKSTERMKGAIEKAGYFREPIDNAGRSFRPTYGPVREVDRVESDYVHAAKGPKALLKQAIPATPGQFKESLTLPADEVQKKRASVELRDQAASLERLLQAEGSIPEDDLLKRVPGLRRKVRRFKNLSSTSWLNKAFKHKFDIQDGKVRLKGSAAPAAPAAAPATAPAVPARAPLPVGYSEPALVFRGAVEMPRRTKEQQREDKRRAEEEKERKRQEKRMAWAQKEVQKQLKQLDRMVKRSA